MKVEFTKNGVFTSEGKMKEGDQVDLPDDEVNEYLQKGWLKPLGNIKLVEVESDDSQDS